MLPNSSNGILQHIMLCKMMFDVSCQIGSIGMHILNLLQLDTSGCLQPVINNEWRYKRRTLWNQLRKSYFLHPETLETFMGGKYQCIHLSTDVQSLFLPRPSECCQLPAKGTQTLLLPGEHREQMIRTWEQHMPKTLTDNRNSKGTCPGWFLPFGSLPASRSLPIVFLLWHVLIIWADGLRWQSQG